MQFPLTHEHIQTKTFDFEKSVQTAHKIISPGGQTHIGALA